MVAKRKKKAGAKPSDRPTSLAGARRIEGHIQELRGVQVVLDRDLASIYGVTTSALNQAVKRNAARFPADFRFQLTADERDDLKSQSVTSSRRHGGRRTLPWAFTEHGAIMAATVLNSSRAVEMSVFVVRAFVRLRELARNHAELAKQVAALERRVTGHDEGLKAVLAALRELLEEDSKPRRRIGFGQVAGG